MVEFQEQVGAEYRNTTFVVYRDMKIFCKFLPSKGLWYIRIKNFDEQPSPGGRYAVTTSFHIEDKEKGINFAIQFIDADKIGDTKTKMALLFHPDLAPKN
jgi:hypothetical protein